MLGGGLAAAGVGDICSMVLVGSDASAALEVGEGAVGEGEGLSSCSGSVAGTGSITGRFLSSDEGSFGSCRLKGVWVVG